MRQSSLAKSFILTCLTACLPLALAAQEGQGQFGSTVDVSEVLLDVVVTDRDGNVILGLQPEDFMVDDGERTVEVSSATFYSNRAFLESVALASRLGLSPDEVPVDRFFILFFHDPRTFFPELVSEQLDALRWARRWVHQELLPNDFVAVASYDYKLKIHQDFTTDDEAILKALDAFGRGKDPGSNWPSRVEAEEGPSLRQNLPRGNELRKKTKKIYTALETLGNAAGYVIGRKNLLMFSIGFGEPGDFSDGTGFLTAQSSGRTNFGTYRVDERYYPPMMEALNDANVAVYAISLLKNTRNENAAQSILANSLSLLADDTAGKYYSNFLSFRDPMRRVVEDNNGYYLLSYPTEFAHGDSGYRKVTVNTRNPDFVVRARQGYRFGD
ncbi:MAG: VWA domain-containing protein [Acidobacteria bacterium]|nr:VWA domain-containing protein [Acidobacteriota bacterium]